MPLPAAGPPTVACPPRAGDLADQHRALPGRQSIRVVVADMAAAGFACAIPRRPAAPTRPGPGSRSPPTSGRHRRGARPHPGRGGLTGRRATRPVPADAGRPAHRRLQLRRGRPGRPRGPAVRISSAGRADADSDLGADRGRGPLAHHQSLQQRVRRQPVGAVQPGTGDLADREQPGHRGPAVEVGEHPAAVIVRGRSHRNRLSVDGSMPASAQAADTVGKRRAKTGAGDPGRVQEDVVADAARRRDMRRETASDTTSRGARSASGCTPGHDPVAGAVDQHRALAAHRLGDQRAVPEIARPGPQHCRMELHELRVGQRRTGAQRHRQAVAGGHPRDWWWPRRDGRHRRWPAPPRRCGSARRFRPGRARTGPGRGPTRPAPRPAPGGRTARPAARGPPAGRARSPRRWRHRRRG